MEFQIIFIAGPQGSGKGTQSKKLAEKLGFLFWGMGDVLRGIQKEEGTPLSKKMAEIDKGILLPDELIIDILKERIPALPKSPGIVFEGVPRRIGQAEFLIPFLHGLGWGKMATIDLLLTQEESIQRLLIRAQKEARKDDTPEIIETRFRYYYDASVPTLEYLKANTVFFDIDGRPPVDEVTQTIYKTLHII